MNTLADQIIEQLKTLPYDMQRQVLEFTRALSLTTPQGVRGAQLLPFAGIIPLDDLELMRRTIEEGCERVDAGRGIDNAVTSIARLEAKEESKKGK